MGEALFIGYEAATVLVPLLIALVISSVICKRNGINLGGRYFVLVLVFGIYVLGVLYFTGAGTLYDALRLGFDNTININLIPFSQDINVKGYVLNVAMLIPFGILVPWIWKRYDSWGGVLLSSFYFILLIELSQLCNFRGTDIDDMVMNLAGAALGYVIFLLVKKTFGSKKCQDSSAIAPAYQLPMYIGVMLLGHFLLFNYMGLL